MYNQWCMQNPGPGDGNVTHRLLQRLAVWAATNNVETATTSSELCSSTHLSKKEAWPRHSSIERAALVANKCPADLQTADNRVLGDAWPSTGVSCWATGPAPPTSSVEVGFCRTILCAIIADRQARWPPFLCGSGNSLESVAKLS